VPGAKLVDIMVGHAREYSEVVEFKEVSEIKLGHRIEVATLDGDLYVCKALVLATGATWKQLGVPGEQKFFGRGVSYCASCDGYFYRDKKVLVVGGGNTALTDALHLKHLGAEVTVIHRRDEFRAEQHLQDALVREAIPVRWDTIVTSFNSNGGNGGSMTGATLRNVKTDAEEDVAVDGVFLAIGQQANSEIALDLGVVTDAEGFITVDTGMRTNIPRIYAAGDVTGGIRQIVTAVGEGTTAALTLHEDLTKRGDI
jgi:thioredoxin reductase (NADPH)